MLCVMKFCVMFGDVGVCWFDCFVFVFDWFGGEVMLLLMLMMVCVV